MPKTRNEEPQLMPITDALDAMRHQVKRVSETEIISLSQALDRIIAAPMNAVLNVPAHANSAMDGYALRAKDATLTQPLRIIGKSLAGHGFGHALEPNTCVRITTGSIIPAGADCVVIQENTALKDSKILLKQIPKPGENIRSCGEDIAVGDSVIAKGQRLGPIHIALLASQGIDKIEVIRRLRVAVASTGDELITPGQPLPSGHIYDSNRYGMIALLRRLSVDVFDLGLIPDEPDAIRQAYGIGAQQADAVISCGGVSVGDADFVRDTLAQVGHVHFWKVAIKPGKPFAFGSIGESHFFGLPGNPVSAMVTLHQLVVPILQFMSGEMPEAVRTHTAIAASDFKKSPGRCDYQRATLRRDSGQFYVQSNGSQGSGVLTSYTGANCYAVLEAERGNVSPGETVTVLPFDHLIR